MRRLGQGAKKIKIELKWRCSVIILFLHLSPMVQKFADKSL
jgi:hypothetical protein